MPPPPINGTAPRHYIDETDVTRRAFFGVIAVGAFFSNLLLCIVLLRRRRMLKKPYNILILNLAITDTLTGTCTPVSYVNFFPHDSRELLA